MTPLDSLILGLVEGFTEFLPISSTAHLILTSHILGLGQTAFVKTFEIAIQSGAILAVIIVYWRKFLDLEVVKKIIVAFIPTAIIGLAFYKIIKVYFLDNIYIVLGALAVGGILLIVFEKLFKQDESTLVQDVKALSYKKAALIGVAQAVAIIPGVSRSGATIVGGLLAGMSRAAIVEFSFLLAAPTIAAATVLDLYKNAGAFTADQTTSLVIGFIAALVTALVGIKFLLSYVRSKSFVGFGVYRIVLVVVFIAFLI